MYTQNLFIFEAFFYILHIKDMDSKSVLGVPSSIISSKPGRCQACVGARGGHTFT